jgi:ribosome-associated toxin RatA of RatAB toxin-antitoxin module
MKVLLRIILWLVVIVAILGIVGFFLPNDVSVARTTTVNADPSVVYNLVNDLKTYDEWMPWNKRDPDMKKEYGPKTVGEGAWYRWESEDRNVGKGKLTIVESVPSEKVVTSLEFADYDPTEGGWLLTKQGNATEVKWFMNSKMGNNPFARWMGLMMDQMVGSDFNKGLAELKRIAESKPTTTSAN